MSLPRANPQATYTFERKKVGFWRQLGAHSPQLLVQPLRQLTVIRPLKAGPRDALSSLRKNFHSVKQLRARPRSRKTLPKKLQWHTTVHGVTSEKLKNCRVSGRQKPA